MVPVRHEEDEREVMSSVVLLFPVLEQLWFEFGPFLSHKGWESCTDTTVAHPPLMLCQGQIMLTDIVKGKIIQFF